MLSQNALGVRRAERLARFARAFESDGHEPQAVSEFVMRCIFTMFAEDIGLLEAGSFTDLLKEMRGNERGLPAVLQARRWIRLP